MLMRWAHVINISGSIKKVPTKQDEKSSFMNIFRHFLRVQCTIAVSYSKSLFTVHCSGIFENIREHSRLDELEVYCSGVESLLHLDFSEINLLLFA